jgi:hypothetical protein
MDRSFARLGLLVIAVAMAVAGCASAGASPDTSPGATPTTDPSMTPLPSVAAAPSASPEPTPFSEPSREPLEIPDGLLVVAGEGPLVGTRGSGCWMGPTTVVCDDTPWLVPDAGPSAGPGSACEVAFADGFPIVVWAVTAAPAGSTDPVAEADQLATGESAMGLDVVAFACPGPGDWVLSAWLRAEAGDATYYWRLTVR